MPSYKNRFCSVCKLFSISKSRTYDCMNLRNHGRNFFRKEDERSSGRESASTVNIVACTVNIIIWNIFPPEIRSSRRTLDCTSSCETWTAPDCVYPAADKSCSHTGQSKGLCESEANAQACSWAQSQSGQAKPCITRKTLATPPLGSFINPYVVLAMAYPTKRKRSV